MSCIQVTGPEKREFCIPIRSEEGMNHRNKECSGAEDEVGGRKWSCWEVWHLNRNETWAQHLEGVQWLSVKEFWSLSCNQYFFFFYDRSLQVANEKKQLDWHSLFLLLENQISEHLKKNLFSRIADSKLRKRNRKWAIFQSDFVEVISLNSITVFKYSAGTGKRPCGYLIPFIDCRMEGKAMPTWLGGIAEIILPALLRFL